MNLMIILGGYSRTGKNTVGDILHKNHGFICCAYADPLRRVATALLDHLFARGIGVVQWDRSAFSAADHIKEWDLNNWDRLKSRQVGRQLLVGLGHALRKEIDPNILLEPLEEELESLVIGQETPRACITDVRCGRELEHARRIAGYLGMRPFALWVKRDGCEPACLREKAAANLPWDGELDNSGSLEELGQKLGRLLASLQVKQEVA